MTKVITQLMWALVLLAHKEEQKAELELKVEVVSRTGNRNVIRLGPTGIKSG